MSEKLIILFLIIHLLQNKFWCIPGVVLGIGNQRGGWCIKCLHLCGQLAAFLIGRKERYISMLNFCPSISFLCTHVHNIVYIFFLLCQGWCITLPPCCISFIIENYIHRWSVVPQHFLLFNYDSGFENIIILDS